MKILFKTMLVLTILLVLASPTSHAWDNLTSGASKLVNPSGGGPTIDTGEVNSLVATLASVLTTIGVVIVLAGLLIIGIKYMVATPEEAAKLKSKLVGLAVSGVVIIGAYGIWNLAYSILNTLG